MGKEKIELKTQYIHMWLEGNFIVGVYEDVHIDLAAAQEIVRGRIRVFGTKARLAIIEIKGKVSVTKEARDYLGSPEACVGAKKLALIANSPLTIILGNIYLKIVNPPVPTKIFKNKTEAKKWLFKTRRKDNVIATKETEE